MSLGQFVSASFTVPQNPVLIPTGSSDGLGDFVRAYFPVPQNPIWPGLTGLGDFVPGYFSVPQNPVGLGCASCGGSCKGMSGIGDDISAMFSGTAGLQTYLLYGGGALALMWLLFGRGSEYSSQASKLRKRYPSRASRALSYARGS